MAHAFKQLGNHRIKSTARYDFGVRILKCIEKQESLLSWVQESWQIASNGSMATDRSIGKAATKANSALRTHRSFFDNFMWMQPTLHGVGSILTRQRLAFKQAFDIEHCIHFPITIII
jgi:uncharacterized protein CbrC (UPF0167 family)